MEDFKIIGTVRYFKGEYYSKDMFFTTVIEQYQTKNGYGYYTIGDDVTNIKVNIIKRIDDHLFDGIIWVSDDNIKV